MHELAVGQEIEASSALPAGWATVSTVHLEPVQCSISGRAAAKRLALVQPTA